MDTGDLNLRARRPSTPGANTQILFNDKGVDGANSNLTFDKANTILAVGGPANTTPFILNQGRGTISIQGNATQNDALLMFQNSTGFVGGYVYCSNTELRVDSQPGANVTIYGGGVLTVNVGANQMNIAGSLNVTATGGGGTKVLEVNGANSTGPLCVFDSGGNFGTFLSYRANSADVGYIGSGNRTLTGGANNDMSMVAVGGKLTLGAGDRSAAIITLPSTGQANVTGNLNVTSSINTATFNASGIMAATGSPQTNNQTRAVTGLCAITQSVMSITSNTTLSTDLNLRCDINETGIYKIDAWLGFYHTTSAIANLKISLGGSTSINNMMMGMMCSSGVAGAANLVQSNTATAGNTGLSAANANVQICNITSITQNQPDFVVLSGILVANGTGTLFPVWAQAVSATSAMNRSANSYFKLTKIG